jgi:hypothetical protein
MLRWSGRSSIIIKVATTSSNLKGTYIKALKEPASSLAAGTMKFTRRIGTACSTRALVPVEVRPSVPEEENEALRKELAGTEMSAPILFSVWCLGLWVGAFSETDGQNDGNERLAALEKRVEELGPSIIRAIEDSLRDGRSTPEARPRQEPVASDRSLGSYRVVSEGWCSWRKRREGRRKPLEVRWRTRSTWLAYKWCTAWEKGKLHLETQGRRIDTDFNGGSERSAGSNTKEGRAPSLTAIIRGYFDPELGGWDIVRGSEKGG